MVELQNIPESELFLWSFDYLKLICEFSDFLRGFLLNVEEFQRGELRAAGKLGDSKWSYQGVCLRIDPPS